MCLGTSAGSCADLGGALTLTHGIGHWHTETLTLTSALSSFTLRRERGLLKQIVPLPPHSRRSRRAHAPP
eukprot:1922428-Rhodomonas_salina.2